MLESCQNYGLCGIYEQFPLEEGSVFQKDFISSKNLDIIMNDGKLFISNNPLLFDKRIQNPSAETSFILLNNKREDIMNALCRKNGRDSGYYEKKIEEVIKYNIEDLKKKAIYSHKLNIYLNNTYNTLSIILTDNYAMFSIYRISPSGKSRVPHFVFKKGSVEYADIAKDVAELKKPKYSEQQ